MTSAEALNAIREKTRAGSYRFAPHARERMKQRGFSVADVENILIRGARCLPTEQDRWEVHGRDVDGEPCRAVVCIEDDVIVITVIR